MWRHIEKDNILLLAKILEFERAMALVAIYNKQPVRTYSALLCMLIKVLQPGKGKLVISPAIRAYFKNPIAW